jgi:hypothetical protein
VAKYHAVLALILLLPIVARPAHAERIEIPAFDSVAVGNLVIGFDQLLNESRCPSGLECFWEGDAAIQIHVSRNGDDRHDYELHTHPDYGSLVTYDGWTLALVELRPYPPPDTVPVPDDYVAVLEVEKALPAGPVSWSAIKSRF